MLTGTNITTEDIMMAPDAVRSYIDACQGIRYAAYRAAAKLGAVQAALALDAVRLGVVASVFHHHRIGDKGAAAAALDAKKASDIVSDVFFAANKVRSYHSSPLDVDALTGGTVDCAVKALGAGGRISARSLKTFLVVLSEGRLRDKFLYLFRQFGDDGVLTKSSISSLLTVLATIAEFLGEGRAFGLSLVDSSVDQAFTTASCEVGLSEEQALKWLSMEPQITVWLSTHFRLSMAKHAHHGIRCNGCKSSDIVGMRYQCLRCLRYNLCQDCFFHGRTSSSHKLNHPVQEYCHRGSHKDATKALVKKLMNNLKKRKMSQLTPRYLCPAAVKEGNAPSESKQSQSDDSSGFHSVSSHGNSNSSPKEEEARPRCNSRNRDLLNSIVMHLESDTEAIRQRLEPAASQSTLQNLVSVKEQVDRLRSLLDLLFASPAAAMSITQEQLFSVIESTPVVGRDWKKPARLCEVNAFSPIVVARPGHGGAVGNTETPVAVAAEEIHDVEDRPGASEEDAATKMSAQESFSDLTSLFSKTGRFELPRGANVTEILADAAFDRNEDSEQTEDFIIQLEKGFRSVREPNLGASSVPKSNSACISGIISEISDAVHTFTYQFRHDHDIWTEQLH